MNIGSVDLSSLYDQARQSMVGHNQRDTNSYTRQLANQDPTAMSQSSDGGFRGTEGSRFAGYKESLTNTPVDNQTKSFLSNAFANYSQDGQASRGYYGENDPYTKEGALQIAKLGGYDPADSSLESQFNSVGYKLPSVYGTSLASQTHRDASPAIDAYKQQQQLLQQQQQAYQQQQNPYANFVPGQDYGDWHWIPGSIAGNWEKMSDNYSRPREAAQFYDQNGKFNSDAYEKWRTDNYNPFAGMSDQSDSTYEHVLSYFGDRSPRQTEDPTPRKIVTGGPNDRLISALNPEGAGYWQSTNKDFKEAGIMEYRPDTGVSWNPTDKVSTFNKIMPALTLGAMAIMSGGAAAAAYGGAGAAGGAAAGAGAGAAGGATAGSIAAGAAGAALPGFAHTGLTTGDWGKAAQQGLITAAASGLGGIYGPQLNSALGIGAKGALSGLGSGLIGGGVNLAANAALGNKPNWQGALANLAGGLGGSYMGNLSSELVGGGDLGKFVGSAAKGLTGGALQSVLSDNGIDGTNLGLKTVQGAMSGLGNIYAPKDQQQRNT